MDYKVTEFCPYCENEITLTWDVEEDGYQIYCPNCGKIMMLCSMCDGTAGGVCDWTEKGCKYSDERYCRNNDGWIPVEKALPEDDSGERYIITDKSGYVYVGIYYGNADERDDKPCFHRWDDEDWQCFSLMLSHGSHYRNRMNRKGVKHDG